MSSPNTKSNASKTVSKLVIKAYKDNKFSSITGEFTASINPENLFIGSGVDYAVKSMGHVNLVNYRASPPSILSFSLLFDNTGIVPGSNTIAVIEQVKQLQEVIYNVQKSNNAPNYVRVTWGELDFKGRLIDLNINYSMFQVDGTLVRAEAAISILQETPLFAKGKSNAGQDTERTNLSKANVAATGPKHQATPGNPKHPDATGEPTTFKKTPNGPGAYSDAPKGAYDGPPDKVYHGPAADKNGDQWGGGPQPETSSGQHSHHPHLLGSGKHQTSDANKPSVNAPKTAASLEKTADGLQAPTPAIADYSAGGVDMLGAGVAGGIGAGVAGGMSAGVAGGMGARAKNSFLKKKRLNLGKFTGNVNVNSIKDKAKNAIPKLSLWQRAKLLARAVRAKLS